VTIFGPGIIRLISFRLNFFLTDRRVTSVQMKEMRSNEMRDMNVPSRDDSEL